MKHCLICTLLLLINVGFLFIQQQQNPNIVYIKPRESPQQRPKTVLPQRLHNIVPQRLHNIVPTIVGYLMSDTGSRMLPLYAHPSPTHRHRYKYHTENTNSHSLLGLRLPVFHNKRDCTENLGCDELYDGNIVSVPGVENPLTVRLYSKDFRF